MSEPLPKLIDGFSPGNIERIYRGEPALVNGKVPADVTSDREFEALSLVTDGLSYKEIAGEMRVSHRTVNAHVRNGWARLGLVARSQLAGYFPIDPQDEALKGKTLGDLEDQWGHARLNILQALSVGLYDKSIAADRRSTVSTVRSHIHNVGRVWTDAKGGLRSTVVANGIRASYVQALETGSLSVGLEDIGELTLANLARAEPVIVQDLARLEIDAPTPVAEP